MFEDKDGRIGKLAAKLGTEIESADYTYGETMCALEVLWKHYAKKGSSLLNEESIQEVAAFGSLLG